jgi:hypothetical protein
MSNGKRYVVEGLWSGYSGTGRVCHRIVTTTPKWFSGIKEVRFTDGTRMSMSIRPCAPRERVNEIHGYDWLLDKIRVQRLTGSVHVDQVKDNN